MDIDTPADSRILIRADILGTGFSLENINTTFLPDGAMCFVRVNKAVYALDKSSTLTPETNVIITPGSGPGRWIKLTESLGAAGATFIRSNGQLTYAADGNFNASSSSAFQQDGGVSGNPNWTLTALGGILTYSGPVRQFMILLNASVRVGDVSSPRSVFGAISFNDNFSGAVATGGGALDTLCAVAASDYALGVTARFQNLINGSTLRPKFGVAAGASTLEAQLTMAVIPC